MKYRKFDTENQAVAGVIEALLLVALVAIVISIIQLQYIPQIMEQREADHMDEVSNQFSYLKSMIDIQALTGTMETEVPLADIPIMTQITLGSSELPYFVTAPSYGELGVKDTVATIHAVPPLNDTEHFYFSGIPFSSIVFHAYNMYFPEQSYILEGGGIILNQSEGKSVMRCDPSISVRKAGNFYNRYIEMKFYLPNIVDVPSKNYTSGCGGCFIRTNYSSYHKYTDIINPPSTFYPDNSTFIYSNYLNGWNESLNRLFGDVMYEGKPSPENKTVDISITQYEGTNVVKITPLKHPITIDLTVVDIYVQIGPGWII